MFLGYNPIQKDYKCLSKTRRIYICTFVFFDESNFPFAYDPEFALGYVSSKVICDLTCNISNPILSVYILKVSFNSYYHKCPNN